MKGILKKDKIKVRSQMVTIKWKSQTCLATHAFWVILHADLDGDSQLTLWHHPTWLMMEVTSRSCQGQVKFSNQYFCIKAHASCPEYPQDSKYVIRCFVRCVERRKIAGQKMTSHQFLAAYYKYFFIWNVDFVCGNCLLIQSNHKVF